MIIFKEDIHMTLEEFLANIFSEVAAQIEKWLNWIKKNLIDKV